MKTGTKSQGNKLERECPRCKKLQTRVLTPQEHFELTEKPRRKTIQQIMPRRDADFREFFLSGYCSSCWDKIFG